MGIHGASNIEDAISSATGVMRNVRRLEFFEENDFEISKSDEIISILGENTAELRMGAIIIALITLLGASIGLMNIMLVSVTERTKEIEIIKAVGATKRNIIIQFLTEAMIICQMGGVLGIFLGIGAGLLVTRILKGNFVMPWAWIALGIGTCFIVGLISGIYPAVKAANVDPIESLHYE